MVANILDWRNWNYQNGDNKMTRAQTIHSKRRQYAYYASRRMWTKANEVYAKMKPLVTQQIKWECRVSKAA